MARYTLFQPFEAALHLGFGEVFIAGVDGFEFRAVDGDTRRIQELQAPAECDKLAADLADGFSVVLAEIGNGFEIRRQASGQPDQFQIALALALQAAA